MSRPRQTSRRSPRAAGPSRHALRRDPRAHWLLLLLTLAVAATAGRFGRRGLTCLAVFQTLLPLLAPLVDVFAVYGLLFQSAAQAGVVWLGFTAVQVLGAVYALRLDKEKFEPLWTLPLQILVHRQLMYLVVVQSVVTALLGSRLRWHRTQRTGSATNMLRRQPA